ncbi:hypothetical protein ACIBQZ_35320, partial [Actinoplanes sp. NPDC049599]
VTQLATIPLRHVLAVTQLATIPLRHVLAVTQLATIPLRHVLAVTQLAAVPLIMAAAAIVADLPGARRAGGSAAISDFGRTPGA